MKKIAVCLLAVSVLTGCGMSYKERMALAQAEQETKRLEIQKQREWVEQQRLSRLTPEQRHAEDLAKIKTEQEQIKAIGNVLGPALCLMAGGC